MRARSSGCRSRPARRLPGGRGYASGNRPGGRDALPPRHHRSRQRRAGPPHLRRDLCIACDQRRLTRRAATSLQFADAQVVLHDRVAKTDAVLFTADEQQCGRSLDLTADGRYSHFYTDDVSDGGTFGNHPRMHRYNVTTGHASLAAAPAAAPASRHWSACREFKGPTSSDGSPQDSRFRLTLLTKTLLRRGTMSDISGDITFSGPRTTRSTERVNRAPSGCDSTE